MTPSQPYLLRAVYEWIIDNGMTPQLVADATHEDAKIPRAFVKNDKIILNIHPAAVRDLDLGNQSISFLARFGGAPFQVYLPTCTVMAIYARENGKGLVFTEEAGANQQQTSGKTAGPRLTLIK